MPSAPPKRGNGGVVAVVVVLILVAAGAGAYFVMSGEDSGGGPVAVVEDLFEASQARDCGRMVELFTTASMQGQGMTPEQAVQQCEASLQQPESAGLVLGPDAELVSTEVVSEEASSATVAAQVRLGQEERTLEMTLAKEDGAWKVNLDSIDGPAVEAPTSPDVTAAPPDVSGPPAEVTTTAPAETTTTAASGSGDPDLEALRDACAGGSMADCDTLFWESPSGSELETFAETCGGRDPSASHAAQCEADYG